MNCIDKIVWKRTFDKKIYVSNTGLIKKNGIIIKPFERVRGYLGTMINKKPMLLNRLVLLTFRGDPNGHKNEALHLDGNRTNNCLYNLKWGTHNENMKMEIGNKKLSHKKQNNPNAKINQKIVNEIRIAKRGMRLFTERSWIISDCLFVIFNSYLVCYCN